MVMYALGFQPEYEELRAQLSELKDRYAERLSYYAEESEHVKKNLESRYMMTLGRKEYQLARLRRETALYQAAINNGTKADPQKVERQLAEEFEQYRQQLEQRRQEVEAAKAHFLAPKLSEAESKELQKLYRKLVHQLHPDLNPDLPPQATEMLHRIQEVYRNCDWPEMVLLGDLVQEMLKDGTQESHFEDTMEVLRNQLETLTEKLAQLEKQIDTLHARPPFSYQKLLEDPEAITQRRDELDGQMEMLQEQKELLLQHLDELRSK